MIVQFVFNFTFLWHSLCAHRGHKDPQNETITHYNDFTLDTAITDVPINTRAKSEVDQMSHC